MSQVQPSAGSPEQDCLHSSTVKDSRKTAVLAATNQKIPEKAVLVTDAESAKVVLRSADVRQAGFTAELDRSLNLGREPVIVLDGPEHRKYRAATARFFTPKVVTTRYLQLMETTASRLIADFRSSGRTNLSEMAMEMATAVAADIVGLTSAPPKDLARRLMQLIGGSKDDRSSRLRIAIANLKTLIRFAQFQFFDVRPAVRDRRRARREDVISHLIDEGYKMSEILAECLTYGGAGMVTTKEFIVVAFWHLMEHPEMRVRFMECDRRQQVLLLEEILRLEPIIGTLKRRSQEAIVLPDGRKLPAGTFFQIDVRDANTDRGAVGDQPLEIDPDRGVAQRSGGSMFSFGDGVHRCPGHQVAMYESAVFLSALFAVPGLEIVSYPQLDWDAMIEGFEIHGMQIACEMPAEWLVHNAKRELG